MVAVQLFDVDSASIRMDVVDAAAAVIHRIALEPDRVRLVIAYNVAAALDTLLPHDDGPRTEDDVVTLGGCAFSAGELNYVVLPAVGLFRGIACDEANVLHIAAHEAYHVLIEQRGERLAGIASRTAVATKSDAFLAAHAASVIEEYRVELAAHQAGEPGHTPSYTQKLSTELVELEQETREILSLARRRVNEAAAYDEMLGLLRRLLHRLAHAVAATVATGGAERPDNTELWQTRIGTVYEDLCRILAAVPSASTAAVIADLDNVAAQLAPLVRQLHSAYWLELGERPGELGIWCSRPLSA